MLSRFIYSFIKQLVIEGLIISNEFSGLFFIFTLVDTFHIFVSTPGMLKCNI